MKKEFEKQSMDESAVQHIYRMETILDRASEKLDALEKMIEEYQELQPEILELEAYYTGQQWKDDLAMDEAGKLPCDLKRGVLSEDGIYDLLERNKEMMERINGFHS